MKTWKLKNRLKESESDEILVYLKNSETGEEATVNLLDYTDTTELVMGCLNTLKARDTDLENLIITGLSEKRIEDFLDEYAYDIVRARRKYSKLFPVTLEELENNTGFLNAFFGDTYEQTLKDIFKWYIRLKKEYPTETKNGESVLAYFNTFGNFHALDYFERYTGYFASKEEWVDFLISNQMDINELPNKDEGIYYLIQRYITKIDLGDIIDTERLGRYLFDRYDLKEYTPSKIGEIRKALKLSPEYPFDAIQFIGDYEDYEDFKVSDERKQFLDSHSKEIQIMEDSKLYKDKEESQLDMSNENFFYGRIAYNYIRVVHHIFRFFFQDEYPVFRKFLDLEELADQILTRAFYTEGDFYFKRDIAN